MPTTLYRLWMCPDCGTLRAVPDPVDHEVVCHAGHTEQWPDGTYPRYPVLRRTSLTLEVED